MAKSLKVKIDYKILDEKGKRNDFTNFNFKISAIKYQMPQISFIRYCFRHILIQ